MTGTDGEHPQPNARKYIRVIALGNGNFATLVIYSTKGTASSDDGITTGPLDNLRRGGLHLFRRITEGENNRLVSGVSHATYHFLAEQPCLARYANQNVRLHFGDNFW